MKNANLNSPNEGNSSETILDLLDQLKDRDIKLVWLQDELSRLQNTTNLKISEEIEVRDEAIRSRDEAIRSRDEAIRSRDETVQSKDNIIRSRDEAILWLKNELSLKNEEYQDILSSKSWKLILFYRKIRSWLAKITLPIRHPIHWIMSKLRSPGLRNLLKNVLPSPIINLLRKFVRRQISPLVFGSPPLEMQQISKINNKIRKPDFYDELQINPHLVINEVPNDFVKKSPVFRTFPDIICFSIIDWDFRYQRPQQIMSQFAAHGHRVFFVSISKFLPENISSRIITREIKENIFEISLAVDFPPSIYEQLVTGNTLKSLMLSMDELRKAFQIEEAISYIMIASWTDLAIEARKTWGWHVVYDCMDEWDTFPLIKQSIVEAENRLVDECDLLVVTAQRLFEKWKENKKSITLARNAVDYDFFNNHLQVNQLLDGVPHPIVGYYGAIADWFDLELMLFIAKNRPDYNFVLIGGIFDIDISALKALPNVRFLGQQPYETMPKYLYNFDACIIPFKINAVTEATDPVKVYEYLCAGKPVVSVALPELNSFRELLYIASDYNDFVVKIDLALRENNVDINQRRIEFSSQNTWGKRYETIFADFVATIPLCSIIIVTYNNLIITKLCLDSIFRNTEYPNFEVIVVDNKSSDGTQEYLLELSQKYDNLHVIINEENHGFAKANNQGLEKAKGEYFVLLNNDTIVPSGWLSRLLRHLQDPNIGIVGPVTNFVGNEAKVEVNYRTWGEMEEFSKQFTWKYENKIADIHMLAMFCVAFRRDTFLLVGKLDEQFGIGMFEDDDYSIRVQAKGLKVICAFDVFVHHFGQAAFSKLISNGTYNALFSDNQVKYEKKWGVKWKMHKNASLSPYSHLLAGNSNVGDLSTSDDYDDKIKRENKKWGEHLKVEASGVWNAWLDHPMIVQHYYDLSLIENLRWESWVAHYLGSPAKRSLDLGCGAGARSIVVWDAGSTEFVEGMDVSEDRIEEGERTRQSRSIPGNFYVADINKISLPENTYDLIFSAHSFHHFLELEHVMDQVSRALTDHGLFILEEFVGPTQFQWTDLQMQYTQNLLKDIPEKLRLFKDGRLKMAEGRPTVEQVVAVSPFESIRSAEILPLFQRYFDIVATRNLGGTIQHLLYNGIMHNFRLEDEEATKHVFKIIKYEDQLIQNKQLPSDFMLLIGKKKINKR